VSGGGRLAIVFVLGATSAPACQPSGSPLPVEVTPPDQATAQAQAAPPAPGESAGPAPWEAARRRGVDYRALGQEPGWFLEIDHSAQLRLVYDYGERAVTASAPEPRADGARTTYEVTSPAAVSVVIERRPCSDVMSGLPFPDSVVVTVSDRELHGCGQQLGGDTR
jgi:uncharacterized membrane protein